MAGTTRPAEGASPPSAAPRARRRIVVAMSGGVDSSVAAGLLAAEGHEVIGITLQLYDHGAATGRTGSCCAGQDIHDARRVAAALAIPHYVLDYERRFEDTVIRAFAESYVAGETPVPCVTCNSRIKFADLLEAARDLGADALATGHYIRREEGACGPVLRRAADAERDQSYFLFSTTRAQLARLRFPLGAMTKREVREVARRLALPVAEKADSQDICFVPAGRYSDVVRRLRPDAHQPGEIVHVDGRVLGRHDGIVNFTVGQRRGLGIAAGEALFVVRLESARRAVVVGPRAALGIGRLLLGGVNWLGDAPLEAAAAERLGLHVRIRSSQPPQPATLLATGPGTAAVVLAEPEHGVAPGQACVFYENDRPGGRVLGGGWIRSTEASGVDAPDTCRSAPETPAMQDRAARTSM